jgi:hypothetical protein
MNKAVQVVWNATVVWRFSRSASRDWKRRWHKPKRTRRIRPSRRRAISFVPNRIKISREAAKAADWLSTW